VKSRRGQGDKGIINKKKQQESGGVLPLVRKIDSAAATASMSVNFTPFFSHRTRNAQQATRNTQPQHEASNLQHATRNTARVNTLAQD
jgi:hypothetical protein